MEKLGGGERFSMTFLVTLTRSFCLSKASSDDSGI